MTTSSFSSSRSYGAVRWSTVAPAAIVVLGVLCLLAACGDDGAGDSCDDDESPQLPAVPEAATIVSQIKLESRITINADKTREATNIASAIFVDTSRVKRVNRSTDDQRFSMTCSGLTGAPVDQCRPPHTEDCYQVKLKVEGVEISGAASGIALENKGTGTYVDADAPDPLFGDGDFSVEVTGKDDPEFFPSYDQSLTPPEAIELEAPLVDEPIGRRDLRVCWNRGNGDVVEIGIQIERATPGATQDTDKVVCLVRDDGCHTVPVGAFDWLMLGDVGPDDKFKLTVIRRRQALKQLGDSAEKVAEIKAAHRVELVLPQDV